MPAATTRRPRMIRIAVVCDACARTRVEIPWPDKHPLKAIMEAAGWPEATVRFDDDPDADRSVFLWPPKGMHLCPECVGVVGGADPVESLPLFGGES